MDFVLVSLVAAFTIQSLRGTKAYGLLPCNASAWFNTILVSQTGMEIFLIKWKSQRQTNVCAQNTNWCNLSSLLVDKVHKELKSTTKKRWHKQEHWLYLSHAFLRTFSFNSGKYPCWCMKQWKQFMDSYQTYNAVWPWSSLKCCNGHRKINIKLFWNINLENIPLNFQKDPRVS